MGRKVMYAVGDSFTFGDELLDSIRQTNKTLVSTGYSTFNLEILNKIHQKSQDLHKHLIDLKNSMTYGGMVANHYGYEFINYAQPGSSIESILLQIWFAMEDMKEKGLDRKDCFIIVGLTTPLRKQLIDTNFLRSEHTRELNIRSFSGSVMIAQPEFSIRFSKPLAVEMGKWISDDQLILDFSFNVMNIKHTLTAAGIPHGLVNVWNHGFLNGVKNQLMFNMIQSVWNEFGLIDEIVPAYPVSLIMRVSPKRYHDNLVTPNGHPNVNIHRDWADILINENLLKI
jgi:hypothetical protein